MKRRTIIQALRRRQLLSGGRVRVTSLSGGVSSEIFLLEDGANKLVVKRALPRLKVQDDWRADTSRNQVEQRFIHYVRKHLPQNILPVLLADSGEGWFVMEYLDQGFVTWKHELLAGKFDIKVALAVAKLLATVHRLSWADPFARQQFPTEDNFYSLRVHPYLITTGERNPLLRTYFENEAERLLASRVALVHGDFSPKNIMLSQGGLILLDHEVACFGDPAFDLAFLLTHLFLKSLLHGKQNLACLELAQAVWQQYFTTLGGDRQPALQPRVTRLLLMLMLARVDGKSPVEYLVDKEPERKLIRTFVSELLVKDTADFPSIKAEWLAKVSAQWK